MKKLLAFGAFTHSWQDFQWTPEFQAEFAQFDKVLAETKPTFCSEVQVYRYIKQNIPNFFSLRYDFSVPEGQSPSHATAFLKSQVQRYKPIPEHILQIALGDSYIQSLPLALLKQNLLQANPNYSYTLLTDASADELLNSYPQYKATYASLTRPQYKSDFLRYLWMYAHGGYYIDIDTLPTLPLWTIYEKTENADLFFAIGANTNPARVVLEVHNGFFGAKPHHPLFLKLLALMVEEPNPVDYGMNVKRIWREFQRSHSMKPYENQSAIYLFEEKQVSPEKFCIVYQTEIIAIGNGCGYPPRRPV
jgi:hypothetical protein